MTREPARLELSEPLVGATRCREGQSVTARRARGARPAPRPTPEACRRPGGSEPKAERVDRSLTGSASAAANTSAIASACSRGKPAAWTLRAKARVLIMLPPSGPRPWIARSRSRSPAPTRPDRAASRRRGWGLEQQFLPSSPSCVFSMPARTRSLLLDLVPSPTIDRHHERVASGELQRSARAVDLFVIVFGCPKSAATNAIRRHRDNRPIVYAAGKGPHYAVARGARSPRDRG